MFIRFLLLSAFLLYAAASAAQVLAGDSAGLVLNLQNNAERVNLTLGPAPFGSFVELYDSLDLNRDGVHDFLLIATHHNAIDGKGSANFLQSMHSRAQVLSDSFPRPTQLAKGDSINASKRWKLADYYDFSYTALAMGQLVTTGNWLQNTLGYAGIRIITNTDTLYGWLKVESITNTSGAAILRVNAWAIEPNPTLPPEAEVSILPARAVYCPGDTVLLKATVTGADQYAWHLPDSSVVAALETVWIVGSQETTADFVAQNAGGSVTRSLTIPVSPLSISAQDIHLNCLHPQSPGMADSNLPVDWLWIFAGDSLTGSPVFDRPGVVELWATDVYGCRAFTQFEVNADFNLPDLSIRYDTLNRILVASSSLPFVEFEWTGAGLSNPVSNDSIPVEVAGWYVLQATGANGCVAVDSILVDLFSSTTAAWALESTIYPNPVRSFLHLSAPAGSRIEWFDVWGKPLSVVPEALPSGPAAMLDCSQLPAGTYFLKITESRSGAVMVQKVLKL